MMIKDTKDHDDHEMMLIQVPMMLMTVETSQWMTMLIMMQGNCMFFARFIDEFCGKIREPYICGYRDDDDEDCLATI